jgi:hypothetical protein
VAPQVVLQQQGKRVQQDKGAPCPIRSDAVQPLSRTQRRPFSPGMLPTAVLLCETASGLDGFVSNEFAACPNQPASCILRGLGVQSLYCITSRLLRVDCQDPPAWRTCRWESVAVSSCPLCLLTALSTEKHEANPSVKLAPLLRMVVDLPKRAAPSAYHAASVPAWSSLSTHGRSFLRGVETVKHCRERNSPAVQRVDVPRT